MARPERSRQERRIARGREADAEFDRIMTETISRVRTGPVGTGMHRQLEGFRARHDGNGDPSAERA